MEKLTLFLCSVACLVAASLPTAIPETVIVIKTEKPAPRMWLSCTANERVERDRVCRARSKSL